MNYSSPELRRQLFLNLYRRLTKSVNRIADQDIKLNLSHKLRTGILGNKTLNPKKSKALFEEGEIMAKFLSRCLQGHQNSLLQLIRIYTNTTPLNFRSYMLTRPLIELEQRAQFWKLTSEEQEWVKKLVLKSCKAQENLYKSVSEYVFDTRSEESWNWRSIPFEPSKELVEEVQSKVNKSMTYHAQYRAIFQSTMDFRTV